MPHCCLLELFSLRKVFKLSCTLLTLFLVGQALYTFLVIRPTTISKEEKELEIVDLPELVICLEPGFDLKVLENYGYNPHSYFMGKMDFDQPFVGWNGRNEEIKSSHEILEEALIVNNRHINETKFITWAFYYMENEDEVFDKIDIGLTNLTYPHGRCFSIRPPPLERKMSDIMMNTLYIGFNKTIFKKYKDTLFNIYFVDKINSLKIYPDENYFVGKPLQVRMTNRKSMFKTKMSSSHHVEGDPLFECTEYTLNNSYNDCIQNELLGSFHLLLGCQPPLLAKDYNRLCNEKFNVSWAKKKEITKLFLQTYHHNLKTKCKTPCKTTKYTTRLLYTVPDPSNAVLGIVFDKTVDVTWSTFSIDSQTFLAILGGSVSSGRTLLWLLVTLLGVSQVIISY